MSYRELWVFIQYLPQESWTQTLLRDAKFSELINPSDAQKAAPQKFGPWAHRDYLMADLIDAVNRNTYVTAVAGHLKDPKPPEPTRRPGLERQVRVQSDAAVLYLDKLRARG
jgi:hypothetical protein